MPNTRRIYASELRACGLWLEREAITTAGQLTGKQLERFQDDRAEYVDVATQQCSAAALRGALRWDAIQDPPLLETTLHFRVLTPRRGQRLPRPIARPDLERILTTFGPPPTDLVRLRTRALFLLLLSSGARISEALSLRRGQLESGMATVTQKGGSEKMLLIGSAAQAAIDDYTRARSDHDPDLFAVNHGQGATTPTKQIQHAWDELCRELGIPRFTSHSVRHSCATELLRQGVDALVIAKHLGHHGLGSIAGYAEVGLSTRVQMLEAMDSRMQGSQVERPALVDDRLITAEEAFERCGITQEELDAAVAGGRIHAVYVERVDDLPDDLELRVIRRPRPTLTVAPWPG